MPLAHSEVGKWTAILDFMKKGFLILGVQEDAVVTQQFITLTMWIYTHTHSSATRGEDMETTLKHFIRELIVL